MYHIKRNREIVMFINIFHLIIFIFLFELQSDLLHEGIQMKHAKAAIESGTHCLWTIFYHGATGISLLSIIFQIKKN